MKRTGYETKRLMLDPGIVGTVLRSRATPGGHFPLTWTQQRRRARRELRMTKLRQLRASVGLGVGFALLAGVILAAVFVLGWSE